MERDDMSQNRRGFSIGSGNEAASNNRFSDDDSFTDNASLKRTRLDGIDLHNGANNYSIVHGHFPLEQAAWHKPGLNNSSILNQGDPGQSSCSGLVRHCCFDDSGMTGFSMCNGLNLQNTGNEGYGGSSSSIASLHSPAVLMGSAVPCGSMACVMSSSQSEGQMSNLFDSLEECSQRNVSMFDNAVNAIGNAQEFSFLQSQLSNEHRSLHPRSFGCGMNHAEDARVTERRNDNKRKLSTRDFVDFSSLHEPQTRGWNNESSQDGIGCSTVLRPHSSGSRSIVNLSTGNDPTILWDNFSDNRAILSNSNPSIDCVNNSDSNNDTASMPAVLFDGFFRPSEDHSSLHTMEEPTPSQWASFLGINLNQSRAAPNSHNLYSRDTSYMEQQIIDSGVSVSNILNFQTNLNSESNATSSSAAACIAVNNYNRGDIAVPLPFIQERPRNIIDVNRNNVSNRASRGVRRALLANSPGNLTTSGAPARMSNASETTSNSSSHVTALPASRNSATFNGAGALLPPPPPVSHCPASHRPTLVASTRLPRRASGQHTASRAALLVDGRSEGIPRTRIQNILGLPFSTSYAPHGDRRRLLSEILSTLEQASRNEDINFEEFVMVDPPFIYRGVDGHDQHSDLRLDVDNMSYEELLALGERIGDVCTGLNDEMISACLNESRYSSLDATLATLSQESDVKCSICQEEFVEDDLLGRLDCGHGYHTACIKQWLLLKNLCPICKAAAYKK